MVAWGKRKLVSRYVPEHLIERPKMGFGIPIDHWLRGSLRDWAESLLDERRLRQEGFFRVPAVRGKWTEHQAGAGEWQQDVWTVLMFQAWFDARRPDEAPAVSEPRPEAVAPLVSAR